MASIPNGLAMSPEFVPPTFIPFQKRDVPRQPFYHDGEARNKPGGWLTVCSSFFLSKALFIGVLVTPASGRCKDEKANVHLQLATFVDPITGELDLHLVTARDEFGPLLNEFGDETTRAVPEYIDHQNVWTLTHEHDHTTKTPPILDTPKARAVLKRLSKRFRPTPWTPKLLGLWQIGEICSIRLDPSLLARRVGSEIMTLRGDIPTLHAYVPAVPIDPDGHIRLPCIVVASDAHDRAAGRRVWEHISVVPMVQDAELAADDEELNVHLPHSRAGGPILLSVVSTMVMTISSRWAPSWRILPGHQPWFPRGFRVPDETLDVILQDIRHAIGDLDD
jgi:hypothetical protein